MVETDSDRPDGDELAAAYRAASESAESLVEDWDGASSEAWGGFVE